MQVHNAYHILGQVHFRNIGVGSTTFLGGHSDTVHEYLEAVLTTPTIEQYDPLDVVPRCTCYAANSAFIESDNAVAGPRNWAVLHGVYFEHCVSPLLSLG